MIIICKLYKGTDAGTDPGIFIYCIKTGLGQEDFSAE